MTPLCRRDPDDDDDFEDGDDDETTGATKIRVSGVDARIIAERIEF